MPRPLDRRESQPRRVLRYPPRHRGAVAAAHAHVGRVLVLHGAVCEHAVPELLCEVEEVVLDVLYRYEGSVAEECLRSRVTRCVAR